MTRTTVSQAYRALLVTGIVLGILPHLNLGLLSDYKICGDSECESPMSRVVAIRDHHGKDCRFLSFRRGDTIFVYHKLTGKREDLWAGSIDKHFGYFPKDAVQEKHIHATKEKVVETQESDFFCMDEFGYPIDSSHLDSGDDEKIQNQESETPQTTLYTKDTDVESPQTSVDIPNESAVPTKEVPHTSTAEEEIKNTGDATLRAHNEAQEAPAAPNEQGGSAPSAWFGSSMTGWLGLREEQPDDAQKTREEERETADSFASAVTGWLGFGGDKRTDHFAEKEQGEERDKEEGQESAEKFRSRRLSLNLEGSQWQEEEKEEMGTLDWLGKGLSKQLGFGFTNEASEHEKTNEREEEEAIQAEQEQPASSSWYDMGIRDIMGFGKDNSVVEESTESNFNEPEKEEIFEHTTGSENMNTSQSQAAQMEEGRTGISNEPKVEEILKDQNDPSEVGTVPGSADSNKDNIDTKDSSNYSVLPADAASEESPKDVSPQNELEEKSQAAGGFSSVLSSFFLMGSELEEEHDVSDDNKEETNTVDGETFKEMEDRHQLPKSAENMSNANKNTETGEEMKTTDEGHLTQSDINSAADFSSVDFNSNSRGQSTGEEGQTGEEVEVNAEISNQIDKTEEFSDASAKISESGDDDREGEGSHAETGAIQKEVPTSQTDDMAAQSLAGGVVEGSRGESQVFSSSGTAVDRHEPASSEDHTAHSEETNVYHLDPLVMIDDNTESETYQGGLGQEGQGNPPELKSSHPTNRSIDIISEDASEGARRTFFTTLSADDDHQDSPHGQNKLPPETMRPEKDVGNESGTQSVSETETKEVESRKEEEQAEMEEEREYGEVNAQGKQQEVDEEKQDEMEEFVEEEKEQAVKEIEEDGKQEEIEVKQDEVEEFKEEEKEQAVKEIEEDGKQEEIEVKQDEVEEFKEDEKEQAVKEIEEDGKQEEIEVKQEEVEELKEGEKQQVVKEIGEDGKQEDIEVNKEEVEELKEEEKQQVAKEVEEGGKQKETKEVVKERKTQEEVEEIKEEQKQREEEEFEDEVEEVKQKNNQEVLEKEGQNQAVNELKEYKERVKVEEEEKQQQIEDLKEEKQEEVEEESSGEFKEMEGIKEEKKEGEDKFVQVEMENRLHSSLDHQEDTDRPESEWSGGETDGEDSSKYVLSERSTQNKKPEEEVMKEMKKEGEKVEGERRDKEDKNLNCSNEPFLKACEGRFLRERDGEESVNRLSSKIETGNQYSVADSDQTSVERTGVSQTVPSEGMERDGDREPEEEKINDAEVDVGETSGSNKADEDVKSNSNAPEVNQIGESGYVDDDLLSSGERSQNNSHPLPDQRAAIKEEQLYSSEAKHINLSDDITLHQRDRAKPESTETTRRGIFTDEDTNPEEREINMKQDDAGENEEAGMQMLKGKAVISEQPIPHVPQGPTGSPLLPGGPTSSIAQTGGGGAFGLFQNAFSFFTQTPASESTESTNSLDAKEGEASKVHKSLTPEQELDSTADTAQVCLQDPSTALSQQQLRPTPPLYIPTSPSLTEALPHPGSPSPNTGSPLLSKCHKSLLSYVSVDEKNMLMELFGRHKLQFLDYILGSSETVTDATDNDESILLDIERLLHHHKETLVGHSMRLGDTPQEDEGESRMLIALQKIEMLLARVRETFATGNTNHQAEASCFSDSCSTHSKDKAMSAEDESRKMGESPDLLDNSTPGDDWTRFDTEEGGHLNEGRGKERATADGKGVEQDRRSEEETESRPHVQPGPPQTLEGVMEQIVDFVHQIAEDSSTHGHAVRGLLIWLIIQVRLTSRFKTMQTKRRIN